MLLSLIVKTAGKLHRDQSGVIATMFALMLVPLIGAVGIALDASRYYMLASNIIFAMDSGGLAAGTLLCSPCSDIQSREKAVAQAYFNINYGGTDIQLQFPNIGNGTLTLETDTQYPRTLTRVLGGDTLDLPTTTTYALPGNIDIALALDNTGSMTQTFHSSTRKIDGLKQGTQAFLDYMKQLSALTLNHIRISIVPFATDVNLGLLGANIYSQINFNDAMQISTAANAYSFTETNPVPGKIYADYARTMQGEYDSRTYVFLSKKNWPTLDLGGTWRGCVVSRNEFGENLSTKYWNTTSGAAIITEPAGNYAADGVNCYSGTQGIIPIQQLQDVRITANYDNLTATINSMVPGGTTDLTLGLAWGWNMVTPGAPLSLSVSNANVYRYVILFTDGENTMTRHYSTLSGDQTALGKMDDQTRNICNNIKADSNKINLYTIGPNDTDPTITNLPLLQKCASPGDSYAYNTADDLTPIFQNIASNIANLHILS